MAGVALITTDNRLAFQADTLLREMPYKVKLTRFKAVDEFIHAMENDSPGNGGTGPDSGDHLLDVTEIGSGKAAGDTPAQAIRLIVVDAELLPQNPVDWIMKTKSMMMRKEGGDATYQIRVMIMAFESHNIEAYRDENVDDLILKPLDRSVFMQKVEILLAEKPNIEPTFLFRQKTNISIDVGKDATIEEVSDFGIGIRNPGQLSEGVYAAIYSPIFGAGADGKVIARSYQSAPHPGGGRGYLVRFTFFGLNSRQLANMRKFVRTEQSKKGSETKTKQKSVSAAQAWAAKPIDRSFEKRNIAIIDINRTNALEVQSILQNNFKGLQIQVFNSFSRLMSDMANTMTGRSSAPGANDRARGALDGVSKVLAEANKMQGKKGAKAEPAAKKTPAFPNGGRLTLVISNDQYRVVRMEPHPRKDTVILGREAQEWLDRPELFSESVSKEDVNGFEEYIAYLQTGSKGKFYFRMLDAEAKVLYFEADGSLDRSGEDDGLVLARLKLHEIEEARWAAETGADQQVDPETLRFEAIFIDGSMIGSDPRSWYDQLEAMLKKTGLLRTGGTMPRIFVMADEDAKIPFDAYRFKGITDFFYKPMDRRFIASKLNALIEGLTWVQEPDGPPFVSSEFVAKIARETKMNEISEYGIAILNATPFKPGVYVRFFNPIFGDNPEGVLGRCVFCEKIEEGEGTGAHHCHFVFFGASDDLLKKIRTWIREDYVARKER